MKQQNPMFGSGSADGHAAVVFQQNPCLKDGCFLLQDLNVILDSAALASGGGQHQGALIRQADTPLLLECQRQGSILQQCVSRH